MKQTNRFLRPYTERERKRKPFIVCDIETDGLYGRFICGAYMREGDGVIRYFHSPAEWIQEIFAYQNRGHVWYAHNGGEYDYKYLLEELVKLVDRGATVQPWVQFNKRVIGFSIRRGNKLWELRDSYAVLPQPLDQLATSFAPDLPKLDIGLRDGVTFDFYNPAHQAYLERDVRALMAVLVRFDTFILEQFNVHMRRSASSTALTVWRRTLTRHYIRMPHDIEAIAREAYYGGLCYVRTTKRLENIICLDVNAMYASVMRCGVPHGRTVRTKHFHADKPGFYHVRVHCPHDVPMTFIGKRLKTGTSWPRGDFETFTTSIEMKKAIDYGYTFDVINGYYFPDGLIYPFNTVIDAFEWLELRALDETERQSIKILRTSLYGKFGTRPNFVEYIVARERPDASWYYAIQDTEDGPDIVPFLFCHDTEMDTMYMMPHWSAWITANARLELVRLNEVIGHEFIPYSDTDSIWLDVDLAAGAIAGELIAIGRNYGELKLEYDCAWFQVNAPKDYDGQLRNGERIFASKGIPARAQTIPMRDARLAGTLTTVQFDANRATIRIIGTSAPFSEPAQRTMSSMDAAPNWETEGDEIQPITLE